MRIKVFFFRKKEKALPASAVNKLFDSGVHFVSQNAEVDDCASNLISTELRIFFSHNKDQVWEVCKHILPPPNQALEGLVGFARKRCMVWYFLKLLFEIVSEPQCLRIHWTMSTYASIKWWLRPALANSACAFVY